MLILGLALVSQNVLAIGQMTQPIIKENVLRGQEVTDILILSNPDSKDEACRLAGEGVIADWASFYKIDDQNLENPITEVLIPAESGLRVFVKFSVPQDAPNGEYTGEVVLYNIPGQGEEVVDDNVSVKITQRIGREVMIGVTDQEIVEFRTSIIPLKYGLAQNEPLKIKAIYDNKGNVSIKPEVQLKVTQFDTGKIVHNAIYPYPENEDAVRVFSSKIFETLIEWQTTGQEKGAYKAEIDVLLNNKVYQQEDFSFSIGAASSVLGASAINFKVIWPVAIAVVLLAVVLLLIKYFNLKGVKKAKV